MESAGTAQGYYDPYPRLVLEEPLLLVGHPGSGVAHVARAICGRTGLAFNHVERSAEALAGRSRARMLFEDGADALQRVEIRALRQAVGRRPNGVVAVGSHCMTDDGVRSWLPQAGRLLYVHRPTDALLERITKQLNEAPASLPELMHAAPGSVDELAAWLAPLEDAVSGIDAIVEAGARHASLVADEIQASLDRLAGARPT